MQLERGGAGRSTLVGEEATADLPAPVLHVRALHSLTLTHSHPLSPTHTLTHCHPLSPTLTHSHPLSLSLTLTLTHSYSLSLTRTVLRHSDRLRAASARCTAVLS